MNMIQSAGSFSGRILGVSKPKVVNLSIADSRNPSVDTDSLMIVGSGRTSFEGTCVAAGAGLTLTVFGIATGGLGVPVAAGVVYGSRRYMVSVEDEKIKQSLDLYQSAKQDIANLDPGDLPRFQARHTEKKRNFNIAGTELLYRSLHVLALEAVIAQREESLAAGVLPTTPLPTIHLATPLIAALHLYRDGRSKSNRAEVVAQAEAITLPINRAKYVELKAAAAAIHMNMGCFETVGLPTTYFDTRLQVLTRLEKRLADRSFDASEALFNEDEELDTTL